MLTVIIPTIGRDTLKRTLDSLIAQSDTRWKALVLFDGVEPTMTSPDARIHMERITKRGEGRNAAALVRNHGVGSADTEWVAFVDDDDTLDPQYVQTFAQEIQSFPQIDLVLFRMAVKNQSPFVPSPQNIVPPLDAEGLRRNEVGISFAFRRSLYPQFHMLPSSTEDFDFLNRVRAAGRPMMISPFVLYFVRDAPYDAGFCGHRVMINQK